MSFINSYKRLEKLCNDMYSTTHGGVTCYIEDMEKRADGNCHVDSWTKDYKQLKYYRHIRNMIVHDVDCEEEDMCDINDEQWINSFYNRILNQSDPLALYHKSKQRNKTITYTKQNITYMPNTMEYVPKSTTILIALICIALIITMMLGFIYFLF